MTLPRRLRIALSAAFGLVGRPLVRLLPSGTVAGFRLRYACAEADRAWFNECLVRAADLLTEWDPAALAWMQRTLPPVAIVMGLGSRTTGAYVAALNVCFVDPRQMREMSPLSAALTLALMLLRLSVWARLGRAGFSERWARTPEQLRRLERVATRAELAFAQKLPGGHVAGLKTAELAALT